MSHTPESVATPPLRASDNPSTSEAGRAGVLVSGALLGRGRHARTPPSKTPEGRAAYNRRLFERHGGKQLFWRNANLKAKYGITAAQYDQMLEAQGHGCAICGRRECKSGKALAVDHSHVTGKVRGLLCGDCNKALGLLADSPELLKRAARYLEPKP